MSTRKLTAAADAACPVRLAPKAAPATRGTPGMGEEFAAKLRQLKTAQAQAIKIAKVVNDGELKLEEASTKLAIQLIMEMLVLMKELKGDQSQHIVKVLDVLARLQASNVLREKLAGFCDDCGLLVGPGIIEV